MLYSMKKKISAVLLCVVFLAVLFGAFGCRDEGTKDAAVGEEKVIVYLGDSIAEAVAGPSPLTERETYGYYGILGNINGYTFYNRAVSGYQTKDLLTFIQREDDGVNMVKSLVSTADIIHISILGNDLLGYDISSMIIEAGSDTFETEDKRLETAYENLDKIITTLHEMNPDATVILQTLYNPIGENSPLVSSRAKSALAAQSYVAKDFHKLAGKMISRLNDVLYRYLEENTKKTLLGKVKYQPFYLVDVYSAFEEVYKKNYSRWQSLFCPDGIHPANEGHAIIAEENQKMLESLGLAAENSLQRYKSLRNEQLNRLYKGIISVSPVVEDINACTDMADVTFTYFDAVSGKTPYYANEPTYKGTHFDENLYFEFTSLRFGARELTEIDFMGIVIMPISEQSQISFYEDGTFEWKLYLKGGFINLLKLLIQQMGSVDISSTLGLDIDYLQSYYLQQMFPGFDYSDLDKSLQILEAALGVSIEGIDSSKQCVRETALYLAQTGKIVINDPDVLGDEVGITWEGDYRLKQIRSDLTGETYTAIYINDDFFLGESYFRFTYTETEDGIFIRATNDVAHIVIEGKGTRS